MTSAFEAEESERELNSEMAAQFLGILETAGEQSPQNANVYEKLGALERRAEDLQSSFACNTARETRGYGENCYHLSSTLQMVLRATQHKAMCSLIMW